MDELDEQLEKDFDAMIEAEMEESKIYADYIEGFIKTLFPGYQWTGHEWNLQKGFIKITFKKTVVAKHQQKGQVKE